jgi:hypothetical protein
MPVEMETEVQRTSATADSFDTVAHIRAMVKVGESEQTGCEIEEQENVYGKADVRGRKHRKSRREERMKRMGK